MAMTQPAELVFYDALMNEPTLKLIPRSARDACAWLWTRMFLYMACESPKYGYLACPGGEPMNAEQLAELMHESVDKVVNCLLELKKAKTFSTTDDGMIFCRRQVNRGSISEKRREAGKKGAEKTNVGKSRRFAAASAAAIAATANGSAKHRLGLGSDPSLPLFSDPDLESTDHAGLATETKRPARTPSRDIDAVVEHYVGYHPQAKPGADERGLISARLKEGYSPEDLCRAIDGCHVSPHHCGENERRTKYQTLELIVRDSKHVAQFIELAQQGPVASMPERSQRNARVINAWVAKTKAAKMEKRSTGNA